MAKFIDYYEYIASPQWKKKSDAAKKRADYRCQVCNTHRSERTLDTHHRTYDRLGHEADSDLTVLCRDCHGLYETSGKLPKPPERKKTLNPADMYFAPPDYSAPKRIEPPYMVVPSKETKPKLLTLILRSTGDKVRDVLRLRRVHGIATSYPGTDRFKMRVYESGKCEELEIVQTTGVCNELLNRLASFLGADNVKVDDLDKG